MGRQGSSDFVVLDTKGSCFLCLNQIFPINHPSNPEIKIEHLQEQLTPTSPNYSSLHCLSKYLKIDANKLFTEKRPIPFHLTETVQRQGTSRLKAELCEECSRLTDTFSKLYRNLEKIKMEIAFCLSLVQGKLASAKEFEDSLILESNVNEGVGLVDMGMNELVKATRTEFLQKCSSKLATAQSKPRAKLQNLSAKQLATENLRTASTSQLIPPGQENLFQQASVQFADPQITIGEVKLEVTNPLDGLSTDDGSNYSDSDSDYKVEASTSQSGTKQKIKVPKSRYNPSTGKFECSLCPKLFSSRKVFLVHFKAIHLQITYPCTVCGWKFGDRSNYRRHQRDGNCHLKPKCDHCHRVFGRQDLLLAHQQKHGGNCRPRPGPSDVPNFPCNLCGRKFYSQSGRFNHRRSVHQGVRVKCGICNESFKRRDDLVKHYRKLHPGVKIPPPEARRPARKVMHGPCEFCGKEFKRGQGLRRHLRNVHVKPQQEQECQTCGKRISKKDAMGKAHMDSERSSKDR